MRFLVSRTLTHQDLHSWGEGVDFADEVSDVHLRFAEFPATFRDLAYQSIASLFGLKLKWLCKHYEAAPYWRWGMAKELAKRSLEFLFGLKLLWRSRSYDGVAVGRYGIWFPVFKYFLRLRQRVVMMDIEWTETRRGRFDRLASRGALALCCNTRAEIEQISHYYKIPREKLVLVPIAFQMGDICEASDGGYVFAGGNMSRDWKTLAAAVEGLPYQVSVYTNRKVLDMPSNVTVGAGSRQEYHRRMAAASCVVIPVLREPVRHTGLLTWTNAMAMGKVVIVTDPHGAPDYMEHGVSGFYVNHGDAEALRKTILLVMEDAALRKRIGEAARERAWKEFSPEVFRRRILSLLKENKE